MMNISRLLLLILSLSVLFFHESTAQIPDGDLSVDELFEKARTEAFDGNYDRARALCNSILERVPEYHDVRILLARTYAWEENYQPARTELQKVLDDEPDNRNALNALSDVERWSGNSERALVLVNRTLRRHPLDVSLLEKKAQILINLERYSRATLVVNTLEDVNPSYSGLSALRRSIHGSALKNRITGLYTYESFSRLFDDTHSGSLEWRRRTTAGTVLGRLNVTNRFGSYSLQPEIDWYPRISSGFYGYMNYGYSDGTAYPEHRFGGELYRRLPFGMEASLGMRYLMFSNTDDVTSFTGSLTKYLRNLYFSIRPYLTPRSEGLSRSFTLTVRRYLGGPDDYLHVAGGFGVSPQERFYQQAQRELLFLKSQNAVVGLRKDLRYNLNLRVDAEYVRQELLFSPGDYVNIYSFTAGLGIKF